MIWLRQQSSFQVGAGGRLATLHALVSSTLPFASLSLSLLLQGFLRPLHAQRSPFGHLPGHQVLDVHHLVLLVLERYPFAFLDPFRFQTETLGEMEMSFYCSPLSGKRIRRCNAHPAAGSDYRLGSGPVPASSILFVKQEKRQRDFGNPPLHVFVLFFFFSLSFTEELSLCPPSR